jgi:hypothetical protein
MITATFSNGFTDTYKGHRDVKAAWMITEKSTGQVIASGHSLDFEKASKTAASNIPTVADMPAGARSMMNSIHMHQYAKKRGYSSPQEMAADYKVQNAKHAVNFKIEVVAL